MLRPTLRLALPLLLLSLTAAVTACGDSTPEPPPPPPPPTPAQVSLAPAPGDFQGRALTITLSTDVPATLRITTDGSDPLTEGPAVLVQQAPAQVEISGTTTLRYAALTAEGAQTGPLSATYVRTGPAAGEVVGTVQVGRRAVGLPLLLAVDGVVQAPLATSATLGALPLLLEGLSPGVHELVAFADVNGDGELTERGDLLSHPLTLTLVAGDVQKQGAEGVLLRVATSAPELATLDGKMTLPTPMPGQLLSVAALPASALEGAMGGSGEGLDLMGLLASGFAATVNDGQTAYPYALVDLTPDEYVPFCALVKDTALGIPTLHALLKPALPPLLPGTHLAAGRTVAQDYTFGGSHLAVDVTFTPAAPVDSPRVGVVVGRRIIATQGMVQFLLMPVQLLPQEDGALTGQAHVDALSLGSEVPLKLFLLPEGTNPVDAAPLLFQEAMGWALNPLAPSDAIPRIDSAEVTVALSVTEPMPPPAPLSGP